MSALYVEIYKISDLQVNMVMKHRVKALMSWRVCLKENYTNELQSILLN